MGTWQETMWSIDRVPWHGRANGSSPRRNAAVILAESATDWGMKKAPLRAEWKPGKYTSLPADTNFALVRETDGHVAGVVGPRYQILQNAEAAAFLQEFLTVTKGSFAAGDIVTSPDGLFVWYAARALSVIKVAGLDTEVINPYVVVLNRHGSRAGEAYMIGARESSKTTVQRAVPAVVALPPGSNWARLAKQAAETLQDDVDALHEELDDLVHRGATDATFDIVYRAAWPAPEDESQRKAITRWNNRRDEIRFVWQESPLLDGVRYTHYGLYLAFLEWAQWGRPFRKSGGSFEESNRLRAEEVLLGQTKVIGETVYATLLATPSARTPKIGSTSRKVRRVVRRPG